MSVKGDRDGVSEKNLGYFIFGETLIAISLGSMNSLNLVRYGFFIFIAATLLGVTYINSTLIRIQRKDVIRPFTRVLGYLGGFLLVFYFGIQSPQLPFKNIIFVGGLFLIAPAVIEFLGVKSKM
jgi:uncharacterized membrane protein